MAVFNEPTKWQTSLVNSGDANVIPQSTPVGTGEASFDDGFPQITQIPIGAGGIAPDRKDFNGLFKILGDWIFFNQNGGVSTYSENFDYVAGRVVSYNGNIYKCIQANGVSSTVVAPDSDTAYWQRLDNFVRSVNGVNADESGNVTIDASSNKTPYLYIATDNLMETSPVTHENITLSQSWRSFDALLVMVTNDSMGWIENRVLDVKAFDKAISIMKALATGAGKKGVGLGSFSSTYWTIDAYTTTSYTLSLLKEAECGIHSIYGCYYRMH